MNLKMSRTAGTFFGGRKYLIILPILFFAVGCNGQKPEQNIATQSKTTNITVADLVSFFNKKLWEGECRNSKNPNEPYGCFDNNFKSINRDGIYSDPQYQFTDFTGDGFGDALVTVVLSGSGAYREFYALTKDSSVKGEVEKVSNVKIVYYNAQAGYPKLENGVYTLVCPYSYEEKFKTDGKPGCVVKIKWDGISKKFVELTNGQLPVWKTYSNSYLGFSLQYPTNWILKEQLGTVMLRPAEGQPILTIDASLVADPVFKSKSSASGNARTCELQKVIFAGQSAMRCDSILNSVAGTRIKFLDLPNSHWTKNNEIMYELPSEFTYMVATYDSILQSFKFVNVVGLRQCPEESIDNRMPGSDTSKVPDKYFILNGERREQGEFDLDWVNKNCKVKTQIVY